jgi:hypothetical protein
VIGKPPLAGLGLESVDEVDDDEEPAARGDPEQLRAMAFARRVLPVPPMPSTGRSAK